MLFSEKKRASMLTFVHETEMGLNQCKKAWATFNDLPLDARVGYRATFETLCQVFDVEPIGEFLKMFHHFDTESRGTIDFRQFVLALLNFVQVEREDRVRFTFDMFNENQAGYLTQVKAYLSVREMTRSVLNQF